MSASLDTYLGAEESFATFHDARLLRSEVDYERARLEMRWNVCVGDPDATTTSGRERTRDGTLLLTGLHFAVSDSPRAHPREWIGNQPWLTWDGPISEVPGESAAEWRARVPAGATSFALFFSDRNAYWFVAAETFAFSWS